MPTLLSLATRVVVVPFFSSLVVPQFGTRNATASYMRSKHAACTCTLNSKSRYHYSDVIMSAIASQIIGVLIVYSFVCSGADQRKHQSSAPLAFVRGIHRWPANSPHKGPVTRKMFPFDDVVMIVVYVIVVRPVAAKLASWQLAVFNVYINNMNSAMLQALNYEQESKDAWTTAYSRRYIIYLANQ